MLGFEPGALIDRSMIELIHPDEVSRVIDFVAAARTGETNSVDVRMLDDNTQFRWISIKGRKIPDATDGVSGYIGNVRDAQADHENREELLASESRFSLLAENGSDIVFEIDAEGFIRWISPSVHEELGWTIDQLVGTRLTDIVLPDDVATVEARRDNVYRGHENPMLEMRYRREDGGLVWMAVRSRPLRYKGDVVDAAVVTLRNCHREVMIRGAFATLSAGSRELVRAVDENDLLMRMCQIAVDDGGFRFASYGRKVDDLDHSVAHVASSAQWRGYLDHLVIRWDDGVFSIGPTGQAIRFEKTFVTQDIRTDPNMSMWAGAAEEYGLRSSVALPVFVDSFIDGVLMVYAHESDVFDAAAVAVLEDLAAALGFGLKRLRDQERLTQALKSQTLLSRAVEQAGDTIVTFDPSGIITYANPAATVLSGYSIDEIIGSDERIFQSGLHTNEFYDEMWATLTGGQIWRGMLGSRRKSGEIYYVDATISPVHDDGELIAYVGVMHDLTIERGLEAEQNDRDVIRNMMREIRPEGTIQETADAFCRAATQLASIDAASVLLIERGGGLLPVAIAGSNVFDIEAAVSFTPDPPLRASSIVEGPRELVMDLFGLLNPEITSAITAEGLKSVVLAPIRFEGRLIGVLALATKDDDAARIASSRFAYFEELGSYAGAIFGSQAAAFENRTAIRAQLRDIIGNVRFHPVFQPIVNLSNGGVVGYEALTRFDDGRPPDQWFNEAHTVGLGSELEAACAAAAVDASRHLASEMLLSVNFSPAALLDGSAAATLAEVATTRDIVIEITEHAMIESYSAVHEAISAIAGCRLAIDDTGVGANSLQHISELRPAFVKIDIAFIRDIDTDASREAVVAGLCHFAAKSRTIIIAEGVETAGEAETLRELGGVLGAGHMLGQGFYFARPATL